MPAAFGAHVAPWPWRSDGLSRSGEGSGHARGLVRWRRYLGPADRRYARLPGEGYAAFHPELKDVNPEDYPDIHKLAILADVAPYSREYNTYRQKIGRQAQGNTELEIEYEKILARVKKTREFVIRMTDRYYTEPVDEISGTLESASAGGITLKE